MTTDTHKLVPVEPTDFMLTNIARAIGNTITTANHFERAKQVWAAALSDEQEPRPSGSITSGERTEP